MKKLITISLFVFWAVVTAVLTAGLVFYQNNKNFNSQFAGNNFINNSLLGANNLPANSSGTLGSQTSINNQNQTSLLSLAEIAKHNSASDCWLLINNNIYNITSFLSAHPGGAGAIIPYCGKEATQAFNTKDIGQPHSGGAASMLASYYIGTLNQQTSQQQIQQNVQTTNTVVPPTNGRGEGDDD